MKTKHLPSCTAHYLTFGGYCLECGINAPKPRKETKEERIEHLKLFGFKFPETKLT